MTNSEAGINKLEVTNAEFTPGTIVPLDREEDKKFYVPIVKMAEQLLADGYKFRLYDDNMTVAVAYPDGRVRHFMKFAQFPQSDSNPSIRRPIEGVIEKAIKEDLK